MSLILEALKKLDREKQAPDRGLLVVGPSEWPTARDSRPGVGAAAAIALVLLAIGAGVWLFGGRPSTVVPHEMAPREVAPRDGAGRDETGRAVAGREERNAAVAAAPPAPRAAAVARAVPEPLPRDIASPQRAPAVAEAPPLDDPRREPAPDPTARIKEPKRAAGVVQLQAISAQEGQPVAILNDRLVREGDSFDGVRVVRIGTDEVEIEVAGRRRVLKF